jgi:hypothetical protein
MAAVECAAAAAEGSRVEGIEAFESVMLSAGKYFVKRN